jgi:hypothetical protein
MEQDIRSLISLIKESEIEDDDDMVDVVALTNKISNNLDKYINDKNVEQAFMARAKTKLDNMHRQLSENDIVLSRLEDQIYTARMSDEEKAKTISSLEITINNVWEQNKLLEEQLYTEKYKPHPDEPSTRTIEYYTTIIEANDKLLEQKNKTIKDLEDKISEAYSKISEYDKDMKLKTDTVYDLETQLASLSNQQVISDKISNDTNLNLELELLRAEETIRALNRELSENRKFTPRTPLLDPRRKNQQQEQCCCCTIT